MASVANKRIARNTMMLYIRMLFTMAVSLYTSRVVLNTLGVEDFGIYNVIGGVAVMMSVLNGTMSIAVQRFLSFELGQKDEQQLRKTFNISIYTHIAIAVIVLLMAETVGLWFVANKLVIPDNRMYAAIWVYHLSVFACMLSIIQVPYTAAIISNEKMDIYAYLGIIDVVFRLLIAYILLVGNFDKLILYGFLTLGVMILTTSINVIYSKRNFPETRFYFVWDGNLFKRMVSFAGWNLFGEVAWIFASQGINIVLNLFYGPIVNSARAVSYQVSGAISRFATNFQTALNPQIIKTYANKDLPAMFNLLYNGTRFSYYLIFLLSLPVLLETEYILKLWLVNVPDYTVIFCRLVIINYLFDVLSNLLGTVADAYGNIKRFKFFSSLTLLSSFPISYFILKNGGSPESALYVYGCIVICFLFVSLYMLKQMINLSIRVFMKEVILNIIIVSGVSIIVPLFYRIYAPNFGFVRFVISTIISVISVVLAVYFTGLKNNERAVIKKYIKTYSKKFFFKFK